MCQFGVEETLRKQYEKEKKKAEKQLKSVNKQLAEVIAREAAAAQSLSSADEKEKTIAQVCHLQIFVLQQRTRSSSSFG